MCAMVDAPTPPLAPTIASMRPTGLASGEENKPQTERTISSVPMGEIRIVADPAAHQLAIEHDVIETADDDHTRIAVTNLRQLIERPKQCVAVLVRTR